MYLIFTKRNVIIFFLYFTDEQTLKKSRKLQVRVHKCKLPSATLLSSRASARHIEAYVEYMQALPNRGVYPTTT
jgi:hypothetical protein